MHNNKAYYNYPQATMKDLNGQIRRNEGAMSKNTHRLKKLDGVYKKNYIVGLKFETQVKWKRLEETSAHSYPEVAEKRSEDPEVKNKKKPVEVDQKAKREAEEREEMLMLQKQQQAKKEKALKEQQEKEQAERAKAAQHTDGDKAEF